MSMNLAEMRDLIRAEANIGGLREYETLIDAILNQEYYALTGKSPYEELKQTITFTSPADGTFEYNIPADFQLLGSVTYKRPTTDPDYTLGLSRGSKDLWLVYTSGYPQYYRRVANKLTIYPYTGFLLNETVDLVYYKFQVLVEDTDTLLVPSLEKVLIQFVMARMLRMTDTKRAQMAKAEGQQAWQDVRAENAGN